MSTRASNWVWELEDLGPSEMLVLLALADQANDAGVAWPAQGSLARRARQTDRNVRRMLVKLERMGLLSVERRSSSHGRKSNRYRLHVGARIGESLESRQPDNRSGCARGQIVRLCNRTLVSSRNRTLMSGCPLLLTTI